MREATICDQCGARKVEYTFALNKGLAICLRKMAEHVGRTVELKELGLTTSQWTNFQKLRYWGFIAAVGKTRKGGFWTITRRGFDFACGLTSEFKSVVMYRNKFQRYEGIKILFSEISDGYLYRADYAEMASTQIKFPMEETNGETTTGESPQPSV